MSDLQKLKIQVELLEELMQKGGLNEVGERFLKNLRLRLIALIGG